MSDGYRRTLFGRSAAFPNRYARQSHDDTRELDGTRTVTQDWNNRASWYSSGVATPSYQEALHSCIHLAKITRPGTLFDQNRPHDR
jgi:hypothetical protein